MSKCVRLFPALALIASAAGFIGYLAAREMHDYREDLHREVAAHQVPLTESERKERLEYQALDMVCPLPGQGDLAPVAEYRKQHTKDVAAYQECMRDLLQVVNRAAYEKR